MKRTRTSNAWLREHVNDTYVQRAKSEGYRSRAAFKLMEIDDRDHLIRAGEVVVDLGATPAQLTDDIGVPHETGDSHRQPGTTLGNLGFRCARSQP